MWPPRVRGWRSCRSNSNLAVFGEFSLKFSTQLSPASPPWAECRGFIEQVSETNRKQIKNRKAENENQQIVPCHGSGDVIGTSIRVYSLHLWVELSPSRAGVCAGTSGGLLLLSVLLGRV